MNKVSETSTSKVFADRLSDLIAESGKTIKTLSKEIGISEGALSKYQNDGAAPSINALAKMAVYFGVSADWLIGLSNKQNHDVSISEYTGLTEQSIEAIRKMDGKTLAGLNALLGGMGAQ